MNWKTCLRLSLTILLCLTTTVFAGEADDAERASETIIDLIGTNKYSKVWDRHMSDSFKSTMTEDQFRSGLTFGRQTLGSRKSKLLIDKNHSNGDPQTGYQGSVYAFNYKNTYSNNNIALYERVVVINEDGDGFKLAGFWVQPVQ